MQKYYEKQKILAQSHLPNTNAVTMLSPPRKQKNLVSHVYIANLTASAVKVRLYANTAGSAVTNTNALFYDKVFAANDVTVYEFKMPLGIEYPGALVAQSNTANAVTVTVMGCDAEGQSNGV